MSSTSFDLETTAQLVSMRLSSYHCFPNFQVSTQTPLPGHLGVRLSTSEGWCLVQASLFLTWLEQTNPTDEQLLTALQKKRKQLLQRFRRHE